MAISKALIVVDVQRDFCEGGALPATDTLSLIHPLQDFIVAARAARVLVVFTRDWHPHNHSSFQSMGGPWPEHCVSNTPGAQLMPPLVESPGDLAVRKGEAADKAGYSAFEDTGLAEKLHLMDVELIGVCGIATEFCVRATAMDAAHAGFRVSVLTDLIRPVQVIAAESTLRELSALGIEPVSSTTWLANS